MDYWQEKEMYLNFLSSESDSDAEEEVLLYSVMDKKYKSPNNSYLSKRKSHGQFKMTSEFNDDVFTNYFSMNRSQFSEIHEIIKQSIESDGCNAQKPIGTEEKLSVFLRYLASGDSYRSIAHSYRMGDRTVSNIVKEISVAIWKHLQPAYLPEPTTQTWQSVACRFDERWQFPHCVGAIGGKHVVIKKPGKSGSSYRNSKPPFYVLLLATVDADYKFITIDVGTMGRFGDGSLFSNSVLNKKMMKNSLLLPVPAQLPAITDLIPYVFVGDEAFTLSENVMRPYPRKHVTENYEHQVFNARLFRARQTVEHTFSVLASKFRAFRRPFESKVKTVRDVIKAACVMHNYLRSTVLPSYGDVDDIEKLPHTQLLPLRGSRLRNSRKSFAVREKFTKYFNNWGAVPWQHQGVVLGKY